MNDKPIYTMDFVPTPKSFGNVGTILIIFATIFVFFLGVTYDFFVLIIAIIILTMAGFAGREYEASFYKDVLEHDPELKKRFWDLAKSIVKKEIEDSEKINKKEREKKEDN